MIYPEICSLPRWKICYVLEFYTIFYFSIIMKEMQNKTEEPLSYKITKDYGGYIVLEAKHSLPLRILSGFPFILSGLPLLAFALYFILYKGKYSSSLLIPLIAGAFLLFLGLGIMGSWKEVILDRIMGTVTFYHYFLWNPSKKILPFSSIEVIEVRKSERVLPDFALATRGKEKEFSYPFYEIHILYEGKRIYLDGSSSEKEVEELARKIGEIVGREVKMKKE
ncbi:MAG: hypothetical protein ACPLPS_08765 [bacterium]